MKNFSLKILLFIAVPFTIVGLAGCKKSSITPSFAGKTYNMTETEGTSDGGKTWGAQSLTLCGSQLKLIFNTDGTYTATDACMTTKQGTYKYDQNANRLTLTAVGAQTPDYDGIVENYSASGFTLDQFAVGKANINDRIVFSTT